MYFVTVLEAGSLKFNKAVLPLVLLRKNPSFASSSSKCLSWHSGLVAISQAYDDTCLCHHIAFSYVTVLIPFVSLSYKVLVMAFRVHPHNPGQSQNSYIITYENPLLANQ